MPGKVGYRHGICLHRRWSDLVNLFSMVIPQNSAKKYFTNLYKTTQLHQTATSVYYLTHTLLFPNNSAEEVRTLPVLKVAI